MVELAGIKTQLDSEDDSYENTIAGVIADKACRKILYCIDSVHLSASEISVKTKIPVTTVYRRLQVLHDLQMVKTSAHFL